jgi:hypothetical protein
MSAFGNLFRATVVASMRSAVIVGAVALSLGACVVYEPVPAAPSNFDRAWSAAIGAMQDQGVTITEQDYSRGVLRGSRGALAVSGNVLRQADGRVRVEFNTTGTIGTDPTLAERISSSYDRRMGR